MPRPEDDPERPTTRYTVYVTWDRLDTAAPVEEIAVDAADLEAAALAVVRALITDYEPGWRVLRVAEKDGLYF